MPLVILLVVFMQESGVHAEVKTTIMLYLGTLFVVAMMCHGELARTKPQPSRLTEFYLLMSLGGVLGGLFNGLAAPLIFRNVIEHEIAMVLACFLVPSVSSSAGLLMERLFRLKPRIERGIIVDVTAGLLLGCAAYGLLYFNWNEGGGETSHPYGYKAWDWLNEGTIKASNGLSKSVTWVSDAYTSTNDWLKRRIFRVSEEDILAKKVFTTSAFFISPSRILIIFLYRAPILICYAFATRPLHFGIAVSAFVFASFAFDHGIRMDGHTFAVAHDDQPLFQDRSFFGVLKVIESQEPYPAHRLEHGTTLHGMQFTLPEFQEEPITYYYRSGPVGQAFAAAREISPHKNLAVIGLGSGTTACYGQEGDTLTYYEIDRLVRSIAENPEYFTFLDDCRSRGCPIDIIMGDARLQMAKAKDHSYDMIIVDAFSSDAIPVHLITRQAFEMYFQKLAPHGYLVVHISNRYLKLSPVVFRISEALKVFGMEQYDNIEVGFPGKTSSDWIVLAAEKADLKPLVADQRSLRKWTESPPYIGTWPVLGFFVPSESLLEFIDRRKPHWEKLTMTEGFEKVGVWTDDYSNLLQVFDW